MHKLNTKYYIETARNTYLAIRAKIAELANRPHANPPYVITSDEDEPDYRYVITKKLSNYSGCFECIKIWIWLGADTSEN
jgi:hypothetical protein